MIGISAFILLSNALTSFTCRRDEIKERAIKSTFWESANEMLTEDVSHVPNTIFQSGEVEENTCGVFEFLAKQANFRNKAAVLLKVAMG